MGPLVGSPQGALVVTAVGKGCSSVSLPSKSGTAPGSQAGGDLTAAALPVCVSMFTPQFAIKLQHCFDLRPSSRVLLAACFCHLHKGDGGNWTESSGSGGHARIFRPIFQTCISGEAFLFSSHHAPQLSLETPTTPGNLVELTPGSAPCKHHLNFLFLRCFGHSFHQMNGLSLSWREPIASIHPGSVTHFSPTAPRSL